MADLYVLDALDQDELQKFISHLNECPNCKERVRELNEIAIYIGLYNMKETTPPPGMEERIFSKLPVKKCMIFRRWKRSLLISVGVITCIMFMIASGDAYSTIWLAKNGGQNNPNQGFSQINQQMNESDEQRTEPIKKGSNSNTNVTRNENEDAVTKKRKTNKQTQSIPSKSNSKSKKHLNKDKQLNKDNSNNNRPPSKKQLHNNNKSSRDSNQPNIDKPSNNNRQLKKDKPIKRKPDNQLKNNDWYQQNGVLTVKIDFDDWYQKYALKANINSDISVDLLLELDTVKR